MVDYDFEFSVILARNELGEMVCYPPCRNVHKGGILRETFWPLSNGKDIDRRFSEEEAFKCTKKIAEHLNVVGLLTVEFFFTKDGRILFNEIAPRAHNSGHVTMGGAAYTSQFEQHIRSICGMPFGSTEPRNGGGHMINILGNGDLYDAEIQVPHSKVHWYGKVPRGDEHQKLGHIVRTNW
ncbi:MAG: purK [Candidatus Taylorbacteria bacterium]|nr:purK [Candidatus Taylorbacteria bacterium]